MSCTSHVLPPFPPTPCWDPPHRQAASPAGSLTLKDALPWNQPSSWKKQQMQAGTHQNLERRTFEPLQSQRTHHSDYQETQVSDPQGTGIVAFKNLTYPEKDLAFFLKRGRVRVKYGFYQKGFISHLSYRNTFPSFFFDHQSKSRKQRKKVMHIISTTVLT